MISVVIPLYNKEKELAKTLDSLLVQTYQDFEVIIVDDGSTDLSREVAFSFFPKFEKKNIRVNFLSQENKGAPAARNRGAGVAKGDCLLFCDADVVLTPDALLTMFDALNNNLKVAYVYSSFLWGRKLFKLFAFSSERLKEMPYIHTVSLIRKKDFASVLWDEKITRFQDWDLWLTMLEQGKIGYWIDRVLFKVETGGTMSSWLPAFVYKLLPFLPEVKKYNQAMRVIKEKHQLV